MLSHPTSSEVERSSGFDIGPDNPDDPFANALNWATVRLKLLRMGD
jgi:hypothetical protein